MIDRYCKLLRKCGKERRNHIVAIEDGERKSCHHPKLNLVVPSRGFGHEFHRVGINLTELLNAVTVD